MRLESGLAQRSARVELLPLIDIIFLLLVVFIYAFLCIHAEQTITVQLPTVAEADESKPLNVVITITEDEEIFFEQKKVALDEVIPLLADYRRNEGFSVTINGDMRAELGIGIQILGKLQKAGISEVAFHVQENAS